MVEKVTDLILPPLALGYLCGTQKDNSLRAKHIRSQNVFNGTFVVKFY